MRSIFKTIIMVLAVIVLVAQCTKKDAETVVDILLGNDTGPHKVGGEIWFVYNSMSIQLNGTETLTFTSDPADNKFQFTKELNKGDSYEVKVSSQPTGETCEVVNGKGTIDTSDITNVRVYCYVDQDSYEPDDDYSILSTTYDPDPSGASNPIGTQNRAIHDVDPELDSNTTLTGYEDNDFVKISFTKEGVYTFTVTNVGEDLDPVIVLYDASLNELVYTDDDIEGFDEYFTITVDGSTYSTGTTYYLWVAPYWGSGFYDLDVTLDSTVHLLQANVTGLSGGTLRLQNGSDTLDFTTNTTTAFSKKVASGSSYNVTVLSQPAGQTCTVTSGSGTMPSSTVTVNVSCTANGGSNFTLGGTISGLSGSGLVLSDGAPTPQSKTISGNGWYAFNSTLANGTSYNVSVTTQPSNPSQNCTVSGGSGTITADVTTANINCVTNQYTVSANVTGLSGTLKLLNNGGDLLTVTSNGTSAFATALNDGSSYAVTVDTQPSGQVCTVSNGSGTLSGSNVTVNVSCAAASACDVTGSFTAASHNVSLLASSATSTSRDICLTGLSAANVYIVFSNVDTTSGTIPDGSGSGTVASGEEKAFGQAVVKPKKDKPAKPKLKKPRRGLIQTDNPLPSYIHEFNHEYTVFEEEPGHSHKPSGVMSKGASGTCNCKTGTIGSETCTWHTSDSAAGKKAAEATVLQGRRQITDQTEVKYICVWVSTDASVSMNTTQVTTVLDKFAGTLAAGSPDPKDGTANADGIYTMNRGILGKEWYDSTYSGSLAYSNIIPGQETVDIVYYDIDSNGSWGTLGYFWGVNNLTNSSISNQALVFFMDAPTFTEDSDGDTTWEPGPGAGADRGPVKMLGTLAHEFQHMIHYYQYGILQKNSSKTWVNEMASLTIEDVLADKIGGAGTGPLMGSYSRLWKYFKAPNCNVTAWNEGSPSECNTYQSYGTAAAFGGFLARHYGGPDFLKNLLSSSVNDSSGSGMERVEDAIQRAPISSSDTWKQAFAKWGASTVMSPNKSTTFKDFAGSNVTGFGYISQSFTPTYGTFNLQQTNVFPILFPRMYSTPPSSIKPYAHVIWKARSNYTGALNLTFTQPANTEVSIVVSPN